MPNRNFTPRAALAAWHSRWVTLDATRRCLTAMVLLLAAGCGQQDELAPLSGKVTYRGEPLEFGTVNMQPVQGGPFARGIIQPDGTFRMQTNGRPGAPLGTNSVRVTCFTGQKPGADGAQEAEASLGESLIPEHYNRFSSSGLRVEVQPGENEPVHLELE